MVIPFIVFLLFLSPGLSADSVDDLLSEVDEAVTEESYTRAISLLEDGKKTFSDDSRLPLRAGRLYKERELYHLALAEFRAAESLNPSSAEILYEMAGTYGYLGDNDAAVEVLEHLLFLDDPELNDSAIDDLSWMYFKTYRMDDGINLLEAALDENFDRNWAHTLGTLYAGLYNLEQSRLWYMRSIEDALDNGDEFFASVAHYNLSLLEFSFYLYADARAQAMRSLELRSRAGGHMVIGELDFMAWRLNDALESYRVAERLDDTPLARVDMASFYQRIGYLDEAIRFIEDVRNDPDDSWMYHYGVDRIRFGMDLNDILADSWKGKARVEALTPRAGPLQCLGNLARRLIWRIKAMYYDRLNRSLTSEYTDELRDEGNELDAAWNSAVAAEGYRRIALLNLEEARSIEILLTARADPWYGLEMGREAGDADLLINALNDFSEEEGNPYERTLRALSGPAGRSLPEEVISELLVELYGMNPGGLRQYGLSLPVELNATGDGSRLLSRRLKSLLRRSGYQVVHPVDGGNAAALLTVNRDESGKMKWYMSDTEGRTRATDISVDGTSKRSLAPVLAGILDRFYITRLGDSNE